MKPSAKLTRVFANNVQTKRNPFEQDDTISRKDFLKWLDAQLNGLAQALPYIAQNTSRESTHIFDLPGDLAIEKGAVSLGKEQLTYQQIRHLPGVAQIINMARAADVGLDIDLYNMPKEITSLKEAFDPAYRKQWLGTYDQISVTVDFGKKFDASKFPAQYNPKPQPAPQRGWARR